MCYNLSSLNLRICLATTVALPLCLLLCACGGGGGSGIASIPPPPVTPTPTPTPTPSQTTVLAADAYPLSRVGTYDLIGTRRSAGTVAPGTFSLTVSKPSADQDFVYKLDSPAGFLPGGLTSLNYGPSEQIWQLNPNGYLRGGYSQTLPFSADKNLRTGLGLDSGYSYVSMGEWNWYFVHLDGGTADAGYGEFLFVNGDRTPASGIPASGTATYDAHTFALKSSSGAYGIPFALTADFGLRTIGARIDQDYSPVAGDLLDDPIPGLHVSGSAPFSSSGTFDIPLTGTANYNAGYNTPQTPPTQSVTGTMDGAFFGPHAEQVGGVFSLEKSGGVQLMQDAFVGQQHH